MAALKSLNQIYNNSGTTIPFAEWIKNGKELYNSQMLKAMYPPDTTFEMWANAYDYAHMKANEGKTYFNDDAATVDEMISEDDTSSGDDSPSFFDNVTSFIDSISPIAIAALGAGSKSTSSTKTTGSGSVSSTSTVKAPSATILGMSTTAFTLVVIVLLVGGSFAIYKATKK